MKANLLVIFVFLFFNNIYAYVVYNSIPKAGTFLLMRAGELISGHKSFGSLMAKSDYDNVYIPTINELTSSFKINNYLSVHLKFTPEYEQFLSQLSAKVCFIIRDPRDQLISQVYFMYKMNGGRPHPFTFDLLLASLIGNNKHIPKNINYHHLGYFGLSNASTSNYISHIKHFYELFLGWQKSPICYTTKFEDLVGPRGGGSLKKQHQEIFNIAKHIGIELSKDQIEYVSSHIFGGTWSFREGKIGSWKKHFKERHKKAFKVVAGDLLQILGYEIDNNW